MHHAITAACFPAFAPRSPAPRLTVRARPRCLAKAPLLIGTDLRHSSQEVLDILGNTEAIAVNQDAAGVQGRLLKKTDDYQLWGGPLSGGGFVAAMVNLASSPASLVFDFSLLHGAPNQLHVRDLWAKKDLGVFTSTFSATVGVHDVAFLRLSNPNSNAVNVL